MPTSTLSRGQFVMGCSAAIAAMAGASIQSLAFGPTVDAAAQGDVLIVVFLRGAWDALNVVPPIAGADRGLYEAARPHIAVPTRGAHGALPVNSRFGFHPSMAPLMDIYLQGHLAVVHAVGMNEATRSHFDAQQYIEAGTPGQRNTPTGWITRYLRSHSEPSLLFPALATGGAVPASFLGSPEAVAMTTPSAFSLPGDYTTASLIEGLYQGDTWLHAAGRRAIRSVNIMHRLAQAQYKPAHGVTYPTNDFGVALQTIAQVLKANLNLRVATVDLGGWDTHQYQGDDGQGYFADLLGNLALGLAAFYEDIDAANLAKNVTLITISEFGRRLVQNESGGTDHGHGSVMLVMGGKSVIGGQVYGRWPGLRNDQLYDRADLAVSTDYRQVLGEILRKRCGSTNLDAVFPGYADSAQLGLIRPL